MLGVARLATFAYFALSVYSYIPAVPTNDTQKAIAAGLNVTDVSKLSLQWYSGGAYSENVSFQLSGNGSTGISRGVLVHFSEELASNITSPTVTPWIALVSCDKNATNMSLDEDIFTLARDKGAVGAVLYSLQSTACIINAEYADPSTFDQVFDIFSTESLTSAHLIEYQFGQINTQNNTQNNISYYDSQRLNNSQSDIEQSFKVGYVVSPGYLLGTLRAYNATGTVQDPLAGGNGSNPNPPSAKKSSSSALAMVVLYAITGCVSALFIIVIVSGAIRALRHPERYGPRLHPGDNGSPPQSRARGLTRAIIDTFPLVKFAASTDGSTGLQQTNPEKDPENLHNATSIDLEDSAHAQNVSSSSDSSSTMPRSSSSASPYSNSLLPISSYPVIARPVDARPVDSRPVDARPVNNQSTTSLNRHDDVIPAQIGRETCPICIVDFEEGDDIRVLPCDGKHCFHQRCVDPWLLRLSSSCPICRHDFLALENMLSGDPDNDDPRENQAFPLPRLSTSNGRFSRYLRFARHRQHHRRRRTGSVPDPITRAPSETPASAWI